MIEKSNRNIWIEAEEWESKEWDVEDVNTDVKVTLPDRSVWMATFFTYKNIQSLREKNEQTGECMNGTYFQASDMVLIDIATRERIVEVIDYLTDSGEFESVFTKYPNVDAEEDHLYTEGFFKSSNEETSLLN
ncbi:hypothetical protein MKZ20_16365 [Psychrobacillus sp. FSL K6-2684]|uniref:hypothetical protein n=1 Tax=unclassified Psychrobacillus TaxID=2636677 RepID=UPI001247F842|nr:hypothetical protein [Psychrobacillus sp. AK 1817]QEY22196.1 hypothetical protein D0S48_16820 [Psychrobacillus sp. AK 1817]